MRDLFKTLLGQIIVSAVVLGGIALLFSNLRFDVAALILILALITFGVVVVVLGRRKP